MEGPLTRTSSWGIGALLFRAIPGIMRVVISIPRWNGGHQRRSFLLVGALMGMVLLLGVQAMALDFYTLCRSGTPEEVEKAVEAGARVNARERHGLTPRMHATMFNENPKVLQILLEAGG
ncbi:MAG: hypothetical protein ACUVTO_07960 [Candidatus Caldatribacteriaceae bacterium]